MRPAGCGIDSAAGSCSVPSKPSCIAPARLSPGGASRPARPEASKVSRVSGVCSASAPGGTTSAVPFCPVTVPPSEPASGRPTPGGEATSATEITPCLNAIRSKVSEGDTTWTAARPPAAAPTW